MNSQSRDNLRKEVFNTMRKCSETRSGRRILENITHTRRLMYALNAFYKLNSSVTDMITKSNSTLEEVQIFESFTKNSERLPIEFDLCWLLNDQNLEEFAGGYVNLRYDFIPQFIEIAIKNRFDSRFQLQNTLLGLMKKCTGTKSSLKHFEEFYSLNSHEKELGTTSLPLRRDLRFNVFESLRMCSETYSNGRIHDNIIQTRKLLENVFAFYYPIPCEAEVITLQNCTETEIEIISSFLNNTERLPIQFELCCLLPGKSVREFAEGFAALRIELLSEFNSITNGNMQGKIFFVVKFEETIREEIFVRKHLYKKVEESDDEDEEEQNENVVDVSIDNPRCVRKRCTSTVITAWKRNNHGKLLCNSCYVAYGLDENDRAAYSYRTLIINEVRMKYFNLTRKLMNEFSLND